ncbi:MAG: hypothetical protein AAF519_06310 [Bacteroidota bacterium]
MKNVFPIGLLILLVSCSTDDEKAIGEFTGNELVYNLSQSSDFPISGTVSFLERTDKAVQVEVALEGTEGDIFHPVHLHFGDLSVPDADIAVLLNDLQGSEGTSITLVTNLSDDTPFTFDSVDKFNGSVKVHLGADGPDRDVILASGNVGMNKLVTTGRQKVAICKSN